MAAPRYKRFRIKPQIVRWSAASKNDFAILRAGTLYKTPHCVSTKGKRRITRTIRLENNPRKLPENLDSCTSIQLPIHPLLNPIATSYSFHFREQLVRLSSIGAERSASVNRTISPREIHGPVGGTL